MLNLNNIETAIILILNNKVKDSLTTLHMKIYITAMNMIMFLLGTQSLVKISAWIN